MNSQIEAKSIEVLQACRQQNLMVVTAESCTGGMIAAALTEIAGSSDVVDCGFVTYSNQAKNRLINVPISLLEQFGAVSKPVAIAMAEGALNAAPQAGISIAVTGIAGPDGGSPDKPVGLVHIACARQAAPTLHIECRFGEKSRHDIRLATVDAAFDLLLTQLS